MRGYVVMMHHLTTLFFLTRDGFASDINAHAEVYASRVEAMAAAARENQSRVWPATWATLPWRVEADLR